MLKGGLWISGKVLTKESGTTNLSARLLSLKKEGWQIESQPEAGSDFYEYRLTGKGDVPSRKQIVVKIPQDVDWTTEELQDLEEAFEALVSSRRSRKVSESFNLLDW